MDLFQEGVHAPGSVNSVTRAGADSHVVQRH